MGELGKGTQTQRSSSPAPKLLPGAGAGLRQISPASPNTCNHTYYYLLSASYRQGTTGRLPAPSHSNAPPQMLAAFYKGGENRSSEQLTASKPHLVNPYTEIRNLVYQTRVLTFSDVPFSLSVSTWDGSACKLPYLGIYMPLSIFLKSFFYFLFFFSPHFGFCSEGLMPLSL